MNLTKTVTVAAGPLTVTAPGWSAWQGALQRAAAVDSNDVAALLVEVLMIAAKQPDGTPVPRADLEALPVSDGDALLTALLQLLEEQRREIALVTDEYPGWVEIVGDRIGLRLQAWTFGARNQALRESLRPLGSSLTVDLVAFDRAMVLGCVTTLDGKPLDPGVFDAWPVPLGEAVMAVLERLCTQDATEADLIRRSLAGGLDHPDLALLRLCQVFGCRPAEVEQMNAQTAERLLTVLRLLDGGPASSATPVRPSFARSVPAGPARPVQPSVPDGEGVTRIVVHDD